MDSKLAELAGISQMSASRAINDRHGVSEQTRDKVLRIAAEIGYVANRTAQKLSGGRTRIVGLLTPVRQDQFVSELLNFNTMQNDLWGAYSFSLVSS